MSGTTYVILQGLLGFGVPLLLALRELWLLRFDGPTKGEGDPDMLDEGGEPVPAVVANDNHPLRKAA